MMKRLLLSLFIIAAVGAAGIGASKALLSDTAVLSANTFSTGTVELRISKTGGTFATNGSVSGYSGEVLKPGQTKSYEVWLKNYSTDSDFSLSGQAASASATGGITTNQVSIAFTPVQDDGTAIPNAPTVSKSLDQWANGPVDFSYPTGFNIIPGARQRYRMNVTFSDTINTTGGVNFDFIFTGTEVAPTITPTPTP